MKRIILLGLLAASSHAAAHPSVGIVQDRLGNVFYSDTKRVIRIAPDGRVDIAVPAVHTHELAFDSTGALYGEHLWYDERLPTKWAHRVWKRLPDGTVVDVYPQRDGFMTNYSLVRDGADAMYWADREGSRSLRKKSAAGMLTTVARKGFRQIQRMTVTDDGTAYLIDAGSLKRVSTDGRVTTLAAAVTAESRPPAEAHQAHYQMGLHAARDGTVHVAVASEKLVLKIEPNGVKSVAVRSQTPWAPSGVLVDAAGSLWVLEFDPANEMRVVRTDPSGQRQIYSAPR